MSDDKGNAMTDQELMEFALRKGEADLLVIPKKEREELQQLVRDIVAGNVVTAEQIPTDMWSTVFMPIMFGALNGPSPGEFPVRMSDLPSEVYRAYTDTRLRDLGTIYENVSEAGPMSINGYPTFYSMKLLHKDDWDRVLAAVRRELDRRASGEDVDV